MKIFKILINNWECKHVWLMNQKMKKNLMKIFKKKWTLKIISLKDKIIYKLKILILLNNNNYSQNIIIISKSNSRTYNNFRKYNNNNKKRKYNKCHKKRKYNKCHKKKLIYNNKNHLKNKKFN